MDELDIENFTEEELLQYALEADNEYEEFNINLEGMIERLSDDSKIFLETISVEVGEKVFFIVYGYLQSENLLDYDELSDGGVSAFINELDDKDTLNFIELLIDFKKQELILTDDEVDFQYIISKLKRDVRTLKKKLAQPSKYINTKQFEERYGLSRVQQKGLRGKIIDALPYSMLNEKTIVYEPEEVEKWLENYKDRMKSR